MSSADSTSVDQKFLANSMASFLQIAAVVLLIYVCFQIIRPFTAIVVWGVIISVSLYPSHVSLAKRLGGKEKLSAVMLTLVGILVIVLPAWLLADSTFGALFRLGDAAKNGTLVIPPAAESVSGWPVVGEQLYALWSQAASNLEATLETHKDQVQALGAKLIGIAGNTVATVFQFIFSLIIAGTLLLFADGGYKAAQNISRSLVGSARGHALTDMSIGTIRSVFKGVLGIAAIQGVAAGIGMAIAGIPAAGLLGGVVLVLAIVQLPPLLVLLPVAIWYFTVASTVPAVIFLVFAIVVSMSDAVLKPMLLGRGLDTPMLVILLGAIGGAMAMGIVGLFIGAVVLALGYELLTAWMQSDEIDGGSSEQPG